MKHNIPLGTKVSFHGDSNIYVVDQYQTLLSCEPDCKEDHDCYTEPCLCVRKQSWIAFPLSQIDYVFDEDGKGRKFISDKQQ
jgi:hypothetical protein